MIIGDQLVLCSDTMNVHLHACLDRSAGSGLLFHAGAGAQSGTQRLVQLPRKLRVLSEWGDEVCKEPCGSFRTANLGDGESTLYWLSANGKRLGGR